MSYTVSFRTKVENKELYHEIPVDTANISYSAFDFIKESSGWEIKYMQPNGLVTDWIEKIKVGIQKVENNKLYYDLKYRIGSSSALLRFYKTCCEMFYNLVEEYKELLDVAIVYVN